MGEQLVLRSEQGGVRTLTLNRSERRNALTPEMQDELIAEFEAAGRDPEVRVLVLAGAGEVFCAGLDLAALQAMATKSAEEHEADSRRIARVFQALYEVPVPTIAAVHGYAIAGGAGLASICDYTLALAGSKLGYTETKIGFVPALVSAYMTLQVGEKHVRELLLTGRIVTAEEAFRMGLVNEVVPWELRARVDAVARELMECSPAALRATKGLLAAQNEAWLDAALAEAMKVNAAARETPDFREGIAAFLEKRPPVWQG
ncbi:enoyl-CoA hydratase [Granulicella sp. WH15]|uniref:enoyl-CoA hydratase/isomerase family protein n=1 Tax=Granulicella sp. WH15 TaxID=2602070 RepID=UPI0013671C53|nr:enoyl-CoA hydratase-related protein [Granulicella sp. WH15]QHN02417.1 enoyl-CoA hydratase [Granulicella sp. WH15]